MRSRTPAVQGEKTRCSANWPSPSSPRWLRSWKRWRTRSPRRCPLPPRTAPGCGWSRPGGYASGCASCHRLRVSLGHVGEAISQARAGAGEAVRRAAADAAVSAAETRIADTGRQAREAIDRARADAEALVRAARPTATRHASKPPRPPASAPPAHAPRTRVQRPGGDHGIRRRVRAAARRRGPRAGRPAHRAGIPRPGARGVPQLRARAERAERDLDAARAKLASVRVRPGR